MLHHDAIRLSNRSRVFCFISTDSEHRVGHPTTGDTMILFCDLETFSSTPIKFGPHKYAEAKDARILL